MLNVLYLINYAGKSGTEKYVYNLIEKNHNKEAKCFLVYNIDGKLCKKVKEIGIVPKQIKMRNPFDIKAAKELANYCKENKVDVIHAQYPRENYIAILTKQYYPKIKVIYTSHLTIKTGILWKITNKIMTRENHKIISVCNHGKELLIKNGFSKDNIDVIFNGVKENKIPKPPINLKKSLNIDEDTFVISILARYDKSKGLKFLIKSIKKLKEISNKKFILLICGDGKLYGNITKLINKYNLNDYIKQLGYRSDANNILAISNLYVNSSRNLEALSFSMLEALSNGLPIVATTIGGNPDIVSEQNNCGTLVAYGDQLGMAKAINSFMEDKEKYKKCSKNARKAVKKIFNLDKLLEKTFDTYK